MMEAVATHQDRDLVGESRAKTENPTGHPAFGFCVWKGKERPSARTSCHLKRPSAIKDWTAEDWTPGIHRHKERRAGKAKDADKSP